jgi:2'-5' RNA ligase
MEKDRESVKKIRTFIAIALPQALQAKIHLATEPLRRLKLDAKWVAQENYHLTLKFLGGVTEAAITTVTAQLRALPPRPSFTLSVGGWGMFPDARRPGVFWLGMGGELEALQELWREMEDRLEEIGYPRDPRFHPHLTLARFRSQAGVHALISALQQAQQSQAPPCSDLGSFQATALHLMESRLSPAGPTYRALSTHHFQELDARGQMSVK